MSMHIRSVFLLLLLVVCAVQAFEERPLDWPHDHSSFPVDQAVRWGRLDNGLRYAILHNQQPPEKLSLRLHIRAGSWQETESERGLAHFLEHMAFNGSEHFSPGTMVDQLQALGIAFGSHSNAHTGFDETVYKLDLPNSSAEVVDTALLVLAETADRLLIGKEEVEKERGVILAERRDREGPDMRMWRELYPAIFPGLTLGQRFPIGTEETVSSMSAEMLRRWYEDWYRPERMILTAVGDLDVEDMQRRIEEHFAELDNPDRPPTHPDYGAFEPAEGLQTMVVHDDEAEATTVIHLVADQTEHLRDNLIRRHRDLVRRLAADILNRRLTTMAERPDAPFVSAGMSIDERYGLRQLQLYARAKEGKALQTAVAIEQAWRRMLVHGPTAAELETVRTATFAGLEDAVSKSGLRRNRGLATGLYQSIIDDRVFETPQQRLDSLRPLLESLTVEHVHKALHAVADGRHRLLAVAGREQLGPKAGERLRSIWEASVDQTVTAPEERSRVTWAYDERPEAVAPARIDELTHGIERRVYPNNIVVHLLPRDAKPNEVLIRSLLHMPAAVRQPGIAAYTAMAYQTGGLGRHDAAELRDVLAGVRTRIGGPTFGEEGAAFNGSCTPDELEAALQQWRAWLSDPAWRSEPVERSRSAWLEGLATEDQDLGKVFNRRMTMLTKGALPQRRGPTLAEAEALTLEDAKAWFEPIRRSDPVEFGLVGDIDAETARALLDAYIGSLPARQPVPVKPELSAEGALAPCPPIRPGTYHFTVETANPRAIAAIVWPTDDQGDISRWRREGIAAQVLRERLRKRLREVLGDAYSPYAGRQNSLVYDGWGTIFAYTAVAPGRVDEVVRIVEEEAATLVAEGISQEDFDAVMQPLLQNLESYLDGNGYWAGQVALQATSQPQRLDWAATVLEDNRQMTIAEVEEAARRYLLPERRLVVIGISPETTATE